MQFMVGHRQVQVFWRLHKLEKVHGNRRSKGGPIVSHWSKLTLVVPQQISCVVPTYWETTRLLSPAYLCGFSQLEFEEEVTTPVQHKQQTESLRG